METSRATYAWYPLKPSSVARTYISTGHTIFVMLQSTSLLHSRTNFLHSLEIDWQGTCPTRPALGYATAQTSHASENK